MGNVALFVELSSSTGTLNKVPVVKSGGSEAGADVGGASNRAVVLEVTKSIGLSSGLVGGVIVNVLSVSNVLLAVLGAPGGSLEAPLVLGEGSVGVDLAVLGAYLVGGSEDSLISDTGQVGQNVLSLETSLLLEVGVDVVGALDG